MALINNAFFTVMALAEIIMLISISYSEAAPQLGLLGGYGGEGYDNGGMNKEGGEYQEGGEENAGQAHENSDKVINIHEHYDSGDSHSNEEQESGGENENVDEGYGNGENRVDEGLI